MTSISPEAYEQLRRELQQFVEQELSKSVPNLKPGDNLVVNLNLTVQATDEMTANYISKLEHKSKLDEELLIAYKVFHMIPNPIRVVLN